MSDVLQAFVSMGGKLLGHEYFTEPRISVGSGDDADLFLDDEGVEEVHAWIERKGKRVVLTTEAGAKVTVAGEQVETARLRGFDDVVVGPFTLKFKVIKAGAGAQAAEPTPTPAPVAAAVAPPPDAPEPAAESEPTASEVDEETAALISPETQTDPNLEAVSFPAEAVLWEPEPMSPGFWEQVDDDEDEEEEYEPPAFSMADKLLDEQAAESPAEEDGAGESVAVTGMAVQVVRLLNEGIEEGRVVHEGGEVLARFGGAVIRWPTGGKPTTGDGEELLPWQGVEIEVDGQQWRVRLAPIPKATRRAGGPPISKNALVLVLVSVGFHAGVIGAAAVLLPVEELAETLDIDRFAQVQIVDPAIEEEKKEEEEKENEEVVAEEIPSDEIAPPKSKKKKVKKKSKFAGGGGVLGALARFSKRKGGKSSIAAMVAGITGVKGAAGAKGFSVASLGQGVGGKLVAGGSAGGAGMRTGTRGKEVLAGLTRKMGGRKKSKVRGTVRKASRRQIRSKGSGSLDKAAIARVVNKNIGQVRYCYERTLLKQPNLRGKIMVQWTIAPTGKVRSASVQFSSVTSDALTRCILGKIKKWKFPKPKGGQVIVSYPFIFNSVGF